MDAIALADEDVTEDFAFNLAGRVHNLGLPASAMNSLIPLFEAVSKGLHAIEARWGAEAPTRGTIKITVLHRDDDGDQAMIGFEVVDNGIVLTDDNWKSFRTSDFDFKLSRGGKGVSRLVWLKAFANCEITSRFETNTYRKRQKFSFALRGVANPIHDHKVINADEGKPTGTMMRLSPFHTNFEVCCPKRVTTIAVKLVGHFLAYLVVGKLPTTTITDGTTTTSLRKFYSDNQQRNNVKALEVTSDIETGILHLTIYNASIKV